MRFVSHLSRFVSSDPCNSSVTCMGSQRLHKLKQHRLKWRCCFLVEALLPAESLAHYPKRYRNGNEEQAQTNWAAPAEPTAPRAPMFQMVLVVPVVVLFLVFWTFALVLHSVLTIN